jgi:Na+-transporting methylmalonyl-CoA/oxaloacetate decarboxylase gamma subunit
MLSILMLAEAGTRVPGKVAREFGENDPNGIAMMLIAMAVVFVASIFLLLAFKYVARLSNKNRIRKSHPGMEEHEMHEDIPGETLAAISLALHLYHEQMLGLEDAVITFKKAAKTYSPWSSKIYGLRRTPNH